MEPPAIEAPVANAPAPVTEAPTAEAPATVTTADSPLKLRNPCSQRDVLRAAKEVSRPRIARGFDGLWPHYERQTLRPSPRRTSWSTESLRPEATTAGSSTDARMV